MFIEFMYQLLIVLFVYFLYAPISKPKGFKERFFEIFVLILAIFIAWLGIIPLLASLFPPLAFSNRDFTVWFDYSNNRYIFVYYVCCSFLIWSFIYLANCFLCWIYSIVKNKIIKNNYNISKEISQTNEDINNKE